MCLLPSSCIPFSNNNKRWSFVSRITNETIRNYCLPYSYSKNLTSTSKIILSLTYKQIKQWIRSVLLLNYPRIFKRLFNKNPLLLEFISTQFIKIMLTEKSDLDVLLYGSNCFATSWKGAWSFIVCRYMYLRKTIMCRKLNLTDTYQILRPAKWIDRERGGKIFPKQ